MSGKRNGVLSYSSLYSRFTHSKIEASAERVKKHTEDLVSRGCLGVKASVT
jgi:hypothetical protein